MKDKIYIGIKGRVVCLDKTTGQEVWRSETRRGPLVNVVIDGGEVLAYSNGHLFCLDGETGRLLWTNKLKGLGHGYCIIATANNQAAAATVQQVQQAAAIAAASASAAAAASS